MSNYHRNSSGDDGLPLWLTATVILAALTFLGFSIARYGPDGYPIDMICGGLVGAYAGVSKLIKNNSKRDDAPDPAPPPPPPTQGAAP